MHPTSIQSQTHAAPEDQYGTTADPAERRRLQEAVIVAYRGRVSAFVRRTMASAHWREAEQVGALGLLIALEKYAPGPDAKAFWPFAFSYVRDEIRKWLDVCVFWRKSTNRGKSEARRAAREASLIQRKAVSLDAPNTSNETLHDVIGDAVDVEALVATAEGLAILDGFLSTLSAGDRHILLSSARDRGNPNSAFIRHRNSLVGRAQAFVQGSETAQ